MNIHRYLSKPTNGSACKEAIKENTNQWIHEAGGEFEKIALQQRILSFDRPTTLTALSQQVNSIYSNNVIITVLLRFPF